MATPTTFEGQNRIWKGPTEDVADLPAFYDAASHQTISCWQLTDAERQEVAETGVVWLHVWGQHPPMYVGGECPLATSEADDETEGA